jgi:hypothetical protein
MRAISAVVSHVIGNIPQLRERMVSLERERDELGAQRDAIEKERDALKIIRDALLHEKEELTVLLSKYGEGPPFAPNGHFYSPIASHAEILKDADRIFAPWQKNLNGIALRESEQLSLLNRIAAHYGDLPFGEEKVDGLRYRYRNSAYGHSDAIFLNGVLRELRPRRIVEIGSGHSSCMMLDTIERWLDNTVQCTFIEPYPELLLFAKRRRR